VFGRGFEFARVEGLSSRGEWADGWARERTRERAGGEHRVMKLMKQKKGGG
jgi:hypothetical protein